jgi:hypothetical protein
MEEICSADLDMVCTLHFIDFVKFVQQLHNMYHRLSVSYSTATCFDVYMVLNTDSSTLGSTRFRALIV